MTVDLARDRREAAEIGRRARIELVFARRAGRTVLADAYAEPPFRVGRCFPDGDGLHMILASAAPGIFGGDSFEQVVRVERGARVRLTSQSALQVHPSAVLNSRSAQLKPDDSRSVRLPPSRSASADRRSLDAGGQPDDFRSVRLQPDEAEIVSTYQVADDASLYCHWDPLIPFASARLNQRIELQLAASARLYWSDAFMAGREGKGERWAFASLAHELRLTRGGTPEYLERYRIVPNEGRVHHPWVAADACYFGTTIRGGDATSVADAERLHADLLGRDGVRAATDAVSATLWITRLMGKTGPAFHEVRRLANAHMSL